jgi:hypothetical protein
MSPRRVSLFAGLSFGLAPHYAAYLAASLQRDIRGCDRECLPHRDNGWNTSWQAIGDRSGARSAMVVTLIIPSRSMCSMRAFRRNRGVEDSFGCTWWIATHKENLCSEEIQSVPLPRPPSSED